MRAAALGDQRIRRRFELRFHLVARLGNRGKRAGSPQQIKFGVREFGMAAAAYGMSLHGFLRPAVGTFLTFSDYMRNGIRLAALMKQPVIFVFSHDSIFLAEDGPTHQPVEHLMSLRLMPNLTLIRPGDENEVKMAWAAALRITDGPVALCFTRQPVASTVSALHFGQRARTGVARGAYVLYGEAGTRSGSPCRRHRLGNPSGSGRGKVAGSGRNQGSGRIDAQLGALRKPGSSYRDEVMQGDFRLRVSIEAGASLGWQKYNGSATDSVFPWIRSVHQPPPRSWPSTSDSPTKRSTPESDRLCRRKLTSTWCFESFPDNGPASRLGPDVEDLQFHYDQQRTLLPE